MVLSIFYSRKKLRFEAFEVWPYCVGRRKRVTLWWRNLSEVNQVKSIGDQSALPRA